MPLNLLKICFGTSKKGYVELAIGGIEKSYRHWISLETLQSSDYIINVQDRRAYFGPSVRSAPNKMGKANCRGSGVCWVDLDSPQLPFAVRLIPPTCMIESGGGYHLYWKLDHFSTNQRAVEIANESLARLLGGDSAHNIDRMLRIPWSMNYKYDPPRPCRPMAYDHSRTYALEDLSIAGLIDSKTKHKILTGDTRGFKSRSERDWNIIRALISIGASDAFIGKVFVANKCGDKYREEGLKGIVYLDRTITKIKETGAGSGSQDKFLDQNNCYYVITSRGRVQVSTFTLEPTLLLEGETEDALVCDIRASGTDYVWKDVVLPKSAFNGVHALSKRLTKAAWVWLGKDSDVRALLARLIKNLQDNDVPRAISTTVVGRHAVTKDGRHFFVGNQSVLGSDGSFWPVASSAPIMYVDSGRESPDLKLEDLGLGKADVSQLCSLLPRINTPGVLWPVLGWFMACPLKTELERMGYRFPIHNITGTKGSGKTSMVMKIFQPMLGYTDPRTYNVDTTHFVILSLLGSSNAVPVAFSEYRSASQGSFIRYILLAYDTGRDARGNADQTTTRYPLIAPFSVDGEDKISDPAALERMIVVILTPSSIQEGSPAWSAFQDLSAMDLRAFALPYIQHTLALDTAALLDNAEQEIWEAFPGILPDRVRRNLTVAWLGVLSFGLFVEKYGCRCLPLEGAKSLTAALGNVYSTAMGRAPIAADEFIEYIANLSAQGTKSFPWKMKEDTLWFQLAPSYSIFVGHKARQRTDALSKEALRVQLSELQNDYMKEPQVLEIKSRKVLAYGVDLKAAYESGLDVPQSVITIEMSS